MTSDADDRYCELPSGVRLCYRRHGPTTGVPLVLVAGLGLQLICWPSALLDRLAQRGYHVVVYDNRDVGRSSACTGRPPGPWDILRRRAPANPYDLNDMAADLAGLMDHLGYPAMHVAGMSMGGMIAQVLAAEEPSRVLSLVSIFSTTGARRVGGTSVRTMLHGLRPPPRSAQGTIEQFVATCRFLGPTAFVLDEDAVRAQAQEAWRRGGGMAAQAGVGRQLGAIFRSGDRTAALRRVQAPTLVIHGDRDLLVHPSGGVATARAIAGAQLVFIHGMGHVIGEGVSPLLADLLDGHIRRSREAVAPVAMAEAAVPQ